MGILLSVTQTLPTLNRILFGPIIRWQRGERVATAGGTAEDATGNQHRSGLDARPAAGVSIHCGKHSKSYAVRLASSGWHSRRVQQRTPGTYKS